MEVAAAEEKNGLEVNPIMRICCTVVAKCNTSRDICESAQSHAKLIGNVTDKRCVIGANPRITSP